MLGSKSTYFFQDKKALSFNWRLAKGLLLAKRYEEIEIEVYKEAYLYFSKNPSDFDGATIVKDLDDIYNLDLDAMLHDYNYVVNRVASNVSTKFKADWLYAKEQERKGKGQYSAYSRFVGLTISGIVFIPYTFFKNGKITDKQKKAFNTIYITLTNA